MSQQTLTREANRNVSLFSNDMTGSSAPEFVKSDGKLTGVKGMAVFRSGEFRDSMGMLHVWEDIHIDQMISNFNFLKARGIFSDVPVRAGHPSFFGDSLDGVIGYVTNIYKKVLTSAVDGKEYSYLLADYEILDENAGQKIEKGLWRNRSAEIGGYVTNDEAEYWPSFMGFAYVDIPAVEGLNFNKNKEAGSKYSILLETRENPEMAEENQNKTPTPPPVPAAPEAKASPEPKQEQGEFAASKQAFVFSINGQQTSDFAAVQAHINTLETAANEQKEAGRKAFVSGLVNDNKILPAMQEQFEKHVATLDDAAFENFKSMYASAPKIGIFEKHEAANHSNAGSAPAGDQTQHSDEVANALAIVRRHKSANMSQEQLEKTPSYKTLVANNAVPQGL